MPRHYVEPTRPPGGYTLVDYLLIQLTEVLGVEQMKVFLGITDSESPAPAPVPAAE